MLWSVIQVVKVLSRLFGGEESYSLYPKTGGESDFPYLQTGGESDLSYLQKGDENSFLQRLQYKDFNFLFEN